MKKADAYVDFIVERMQPLGEITARAMFGGHVVYCDGFPFALIASASLYLKADDQNRPDFEARNLKPFQPFDGPGVMQYYQPPPEIFEDPDALKHWAGASIAAAKRAKSKKSTKKPAKKK